MNKLIVATHTRLGNVMSESIFKDWISNVHVTNTLGRGWCVRIDGCNVFGEINQYGVKPRITFAIASDLKSQEEAKQFAINWLRGQSDLHDDSLVTKQAEQVKILRTALEAVAKVNHTHGGSLGSSGNFYYKVSENVFKLCDKALEATKPVE